MTGQTLHPQTKAELQEGLDRSWSALQTTIGRFTLEQLTGPADAGGWTVKDHLAHVTAWERSMVYLLRHQPRHEGLGVPEMVYLTGDDDAINAVIHEQTKDQSLASVLTELAATHDDLLALLRKLPENELRQTYSYFLPDEPGIDSGEPILWRISGNGDAHFELHRGYIERIADG